MKPRPVFVCTALVCAAFFCVSPSWALELHVSPAGDDTAAGTDEAPFRTVERAKVRVREEIAAGLRKAVTVVLHGGIYELSEPLVFGPEDSGTKAFAVTYVARKQDMVVLSGGRRITNWRKLKPDQWIADLPEARDGAWCFRQLVVNGRRAVRAR